MILLGLHAFLLQLYGLCFVATGHFFLTPRSNVDRVLSCKLPAIISVGNSFLATIVLCFLSWLRLFTSYCGTWGKRKRIMATIGHSSVIS